MVGTMWAKKQIQERIETPVTTAVIISVLAVAVAVIALAVAVNNGR